MSSCHTLIWWTCAGVRHSSPSGDPVRARPALTESSWAQLVDGAKRLERYSAARLGALVLSLVPIKWALPRPEERLPLR
jgi:hypothetical protein